MKVYFILLITFFLVACGGGSDAKSGSASTGLNATGVGTFITVSDSLIDYKLYKPDTKNRLMVTKRLHVSYRGEGLDIDSVNGSKPAWLFLSRDFNNYYEDSFDIDVTVRMDKVISGEYSALLRFTTRNPYIDQDIHVDLPIRVNIKDGLNLFDDQVTFQSRNDATVLPDIATVAKSGNTPVNFQLQTGETNTTYKDWLTSTLKSSGIDYSITRVLPAGTYNSDTIVSYTIDNFYGEETITVNYIVEAAVPKLHYVFPTNLAASEKTPIIVRGVGFNHVVANQLQMDDVRNPVVHIVNDTTIRIKHDGFVSDGTKHISINNSGQDLLLEVKPYMNIDVYESIDYADNLEKGSRSIGIIFNELKDAVYIVFDYPVKNENKTSWVTALLKYERKSDIWTFEGKHVLPGSDFQMMPDNQEAMIIASDIVSFIDLDTFEVKRTIDLTPISHSTNLGVGMMNNGEIVIGKPLGYIYGGNVRFYSYSTYNTVNQTVAYTDLISDGGTDVIMAMDYSHSRAMILSDNIMDDLRFAGYYNSLTGSYHIHKQPNEDYTLFQYNPDYFNICNYGDALIAYDKIYETDKFNKIGSLQRTPDQVLKFTNDCKRGYAFQLDERYKNKMFVFDLSTISDNIKPVVKFLDFSTLASTDQISPYGEIKYIAPDESFLMRLSAGKVRFYELNFQ